jgi:hypothetical protein
MKLQWTSRLRDVLEDMDYQVNEKESSCAILDLWYTLREAEFASSNSSGSTFPDDLDWETFVSFYQGKRQIAVEDQSYEREDGRRFVEWSHKSIRLYPSEITRSDDLSPAMGKAFTNRLIRSFSGKLIDDPTDERIDILWLSPNVFVSSFSISIESELDLYNDFSVAVSTRGNESEMICMHFYSLSIFETEVNQYSELPLQVLKQLMESLPSDFFSFVHLNRSMFPAIGPDRFPVEYFDKFFSIISGHTQSADTQSTCSDLQPERVNAREAGCRRERRSTTTACDAARVRRSERGENDGARRPIVVETGRNNGAAAAARPHRSALERNQGEPTQQSTKPTGDRGCRGSSRDNKAGARRLVGGGDEPRPPMQSKCYNKEGWRL